MGGYELIFDYRDNKHYNNELMNLIKKEASKSSFESWMSRSKWDENYIPFALINERGDIVVNIGVMKMNVYFNGTKYQAIQLISLLVREGYENSNLETLLLKKIVEKYENIVDAIYSFDADINELLEQEKGFSVLKEYVYSIKWDSNKQSSGVVVQKVDTDSNKEIDLLASQIKHSTKISPVLSTSGDAAIKVFNILKYFRYNVYRVPSKELYVVFTINENVFKLVSVYSNSTINFEELLDILVPQGIEEVQFGFIPPLDLKNLKVSIVEPQTKTSEHKRGPLVIRIISRLPSNKKPPCFSFPKLSRAK